MSDHHDPPLPRADIANPQAGYIGVSFDRFDPLANALAAFARRPHRIGDTYEGHARALGLKLAPAPGDQDADIHRVAGEDLYRLEADARLAGRVDAGVAAIARQLQGLPA